jgi:hypothetical protein
MKGAVVATGAIAARRRSSTSHLTSESNMMRIKLAVAALAASILALGGVTLSSAKSAGRSRHRGWSRSSGTRRSSTSRSPVAPARSQDARGTVTVEEISETDPNLTVNVPAGDGD